MAVEFRRGGVANGFLEPLYRAARAQSGDPLAWAAGERLAEVAAKGERTMIITGHVHPVALPVGETDGPPGAVALARALVLGWDVPVTLLCEPSVVEPLRDTCTAAGLVIRDAQSLPLPRSVALEPFPTDAADARHRAAALAANAGALVAVEKIGPCADGAYRTASGTDVSADLAKADLLVEAVRDRGGLTIGIGDVGNELGMGAIADTVADVLARGEQIACTTRTDALVIAGCSNWGAYAIAAVLAMLKGDAELVHSPALERAMIEACCRAGAVDGFSAAPTLEVDGASWEFHAAFVRMLGDLVALALDSRPAMRHRFGTTT